LQQGTSRQSRKLVFELSSSRPPSSNDEVTLWVRDGWNDDEKSILNDARAAGVNSPLLFGYLPRLHHEELRQAIASNLAAQETLDAHGPASGPEAIEARKAIETHLEISRHRIQELLGHVVGGAKIFLGGGQEANGIELADKVQDSADSALERLFPQFSEADHANWGQVVNRARAGDVGALSQVGYPGNVTNHAVCRRVLELIGAGKKGKDVRENFRSAPFGWPQDAVDGALFVMLVAGNLRATINGQPMQAQNLPQNQVGVASFYVDVPPLNVQQRLDLKALFQKIGITTQNGKESDAAAQFLQKLLALAQSAGGSEPRPELPDTKDVGTLQLLSGNAQLLKLHEKRNELTTKIADWKKNADAIVKRWPVWARLLDLQASAAGLSEAEVCSKSIAAVSDGRTLLSDPDPVPELIKLLTTALRVALSKLQDDLGAAFKAGDEKLAASHVWKLLSDEQRSSLVSTYQLKPPAKEAFGSEDEILVALRTGTLANRRNLIDAVPQRFSRALDEVTKLVQPKAQRVALPAATINNDTELEHWLDEVRQQVQSKLKDGGPVLL
jgi:hypothetical protein